MREIKLKSAAMTRIGRHDSEFGALLAEPIRTVMQGTDADAIDAVFLSSFASRELCGIPDARSALAPVMRELGIDDATPVHGPFLTGGEAIHRAIEHIRAGGGDALVAGCEKMTHIDAATASGLLAPRVSESTENAHGATLPALAALATRAYMTAFRVPESAFDAVAVKNHAHAAHNPCAQFRREVSRDEVRESPVIADPLRRLHCAPMSDGAAACLLSARGGDGIRISGWGAGRDATRFHDRAHPGMFMAATTASREAFAHAHRTPQDINVVEIHDAFAPFELMNLEAMGFFAYGDAWRALERGELSAGGRVAVNPSGGMKARGHPIGVCGLTSFAEIIAQLRGEAGARQHPGARIALVQSAGGVSPDTYVFIVEVD